MQKLLEFSENEEKIIEHVYRNPGCKKTEIAVATKLHKTTVSYMVENLINQEIVYLKKDTREDGKFGTHIYFNGEMFNNLYIDIGQRSTIFYECNLLGKITNKHKYYYENEQKSLDFEIESWLTKYFENNEWFSTCVVSIHGYQEKGSNNIVSSIYSLNLDNLKNVINKLTDNLVISNETNLHAEGYVHTQKIPFDSAILIKMKHGIGGAIIIDKKIHHGENNVAAEIGHLTYINDGADCKCGNKGCFEQYLSEDIICTDLKENFSINGKDFYQIDNFNHMSALKLYFDSKLNILMRLIYNIRRVVDITKVIVVSDHFEHYLRINNLQNEEKFANVTFTTSEESIEIEGFIATSLAKLFNF